MRPSFDGLLRIMYVVLPVLGDCAKLVASLICLAFADARARARATPRAISLSVCSCRGEPRMLADLSVDVQDALSARAEPTLLHRHFRGVHGRTCVHDGQLCCRKCLQSGVGLVLDGFGRAVVQHVVALLPVAD